MSEDMDFLEMQRQAETESREKVRALLRQKLNGQGDSSKPTKATYEDAKADGNVRGMLFQKLLAKKQERAERLAGMMESIDIKSVVSELSTVGVKIAKAETLLTGTIEQYEQELAEDFKQRTKGIPSHASAYMLIEQDYLNRLEHLQSSPTIQGMKAQINAVKEHRQDLERVKATYISDNDAIIAEAKRQRIMREIQNSGLLDDID